MLAALRSPFYTGTLSIHAVGATLAIAAGAIALATRKGGNPHRTAGRGFTRAIALVACTGAVMMVAGAWSIRLLVLLALTAQATWSGMRVLGRRRPDIEASQRARALDWAFAFAALVVGAGSSLAIATGIEPGNARAIWSTAPVIALYGAYDLYRFARPAAWPMAPRLWLREHIVKMTGAYFGGVSAFTGGLFTFWPLPWRIVVPNIVGPVVIAYFLMRIRRRRVVHVGARRGSAYPVA
jgi:uncharacterized membrane protein